MKIERLAEHSVDVELLPEAPVVLDAGCRGFDFSNAVLDVRPKARVTQWTRPRSEPSSDPRITFLNQPLVGLYQPSKMESGRCRIRRLAS